MKKMKTVLLATCILLTTSISQAGKPPGKAEIMWDTYGIPHIYGESQEAMYYAFGWAQMHNHGNLLLLLYGQSRGRAAEYWGERYLQLDKKINLFNIPALGASHYATQPKEYKPMIDAFVQGINEYAAAHPQEIMGHLKQILPVSANDIMAHQLRVLMLEFTAAEDIGVSANLARRGSNAYAIAPSRTADHKAMLVTNPHLPWFDLFMFMEAHLNAPGYNAYGVTMVGLPALAIAFNQHLGWTHTVNTIDASDRYELTLREDGYLLDSVKTAFENREVMLKVKKADGKIEEQTITFKYSKHGPIVGEKNQKAWAVRIAGMDNAQLLYQWHRMGAAKNFAAFEQAVKMMQLPMFNIVYADDKGNIFYCFAGNVPIRQQGDWKFWHTTIDGTKSALIWTKTHPYEDLPRVFNPPAGFLQNANDPPWTCTAPLALQPGKYPAYMSPQGMELRPQKAVNMVRNDPSITFNEMIHYKLSTRMEAADRFLNDLLEAVNKYPDTMALKAAAVLEKWDRTADSASEGAILFARWYDKINPSMIATPWDAARPFETPAGLKDPAAAVVLLTKAANEVQQAFGRLDIPWGQVYRFRLHRTDLQANGGAEKYGIFRVIDYMQDKDKKFKAVGGDSYTAITVFGKKLQAKALLSYGNATQPNSTHIDDQLHLLNQKEMRNVWFEKKEIQQHLETSEQLTYNATIPNP